MGQSSSQLEEAASINTLSQDLEQEKLSFNPEVQYTINQRSSPTAQRDLAQAIQTEKGADTAYPDPVISNSTEVDSFVGDIDTENSTTDLGKMSNSLIDAEPEGRSGGGSDKRKKRRKRDKGKDKRTSEISVAEVMDSEGSAKQGIKRLGDDISSQTGEQEGFSQLIPTPAQSRKKKRGKKSKKGSEKQGSSNSASNNHNLAVDGSFRRLASVESRTEGPSTFNRPIKPEPAESSNNWPPGSSPALPDDSIVGQKKSKKKNKKKSKKHKDSLLSEPSTMTDQPAEQRVVKNISVDDVPEPVQERMTVNSQSLSPERSLGHNDRVKASQIPLAEPNRKRKSITVSKLTNYNEDSQKFKSAMIKHKQEIEKLAKQPDTEMIDQHGALASPPATDSTNEPKGNPTSNSSQGVIVEDDDDKLSHKRGQRERSGSSVSSSSSERVVKSSIQPNLTTDIDHEPNLQNANFHPLPVSDNDEEDNSRGMDAGDKSDDVASDISMNEDNTLPGTASSSSPKKSSKKRRQNESEAGDDSSNGKQNGQRSKKTKISHLGAKHGQHQDDSDENHETTQQNHADNQIPESGLPHIHLNHKSHEQTHGIDGHENADNSSNSAQKATSSPKASKTAHKTAQAVVESESEQASSDSDDSEVAPTSPKPQSENTKTKLSSVKPKTPRKLPVEQIGEPVSAAKKRRRAPKKGSGHTRPVTDISKDLRKTGPFDSDEKKAMAEFKDEYCYLNHISHDAFIGKVHENSHNNIKLGEFWTEMFEVLGNRDRKSLQRFCRRRWPKDGMGSVPFTEEEDKHLIRLVATHGNKWVLIAEHMGRSPETLRDHYRNVLKDKELRDEYKYWNEEELVNLRHYVGELGALALREVGHIDDVRKLVIWGAVSDKFGGTRSRAQCSVKWNALKKLGKVSLAREIRDANTRLKLNLDVSSIEFVEASIAADEDFVANDRGEANDESDVAAALNGYGYVEGEIEQANEAMIDPALTNSAFTPVSKVKAQDILPKKSEDPSKPTSKQKKKQKQNDEKSKKLFSGASKDVESASVLESIESSRGDSQVAPVETTDNVTKGKQKDINAGTSDSEAEEIVNDESDDSDTSTSERKVLSPVKKASRATNQFLDVEASETSNDDESDEEEEKDDDDDEGVEDETEDDATSPDEDNE